MRWLIGGLLCCLAACTSRPSMGEEPHAQKGAAWEAQPLEAATNFTIHKKGAYTLLSIKSAWKHAAPQFQYLLYPKDSTPPKDYPRAVRVPVPLERVLSSGSVDVAFLTALGQADRIVGISGGQYVYDPVIQQGLTSGAIADLGQHQALNYERAVQLQPDAALVYSIGDQGSYQKYQELGIPAVLLSDFMEETPLGRAEWIVFVGHLMGKATEARAHYQQVAQRYRDLKMQAAYYSYMPNVLTGAVYKGTWYVAGGKSLMAQLIRDAGGHYLWADNPDVSGVPLDVEAVYAKALQADVWINQSHHQTRADLLASEPKYSDFKAVQTNQLYNYYKRASTQGGSDIFESAIVHPDRVLHDLMQVFQAIPKGLEPDSLYYYAPLQ